MLQQVPPKGYGLAYVNGLHRSGPWFYDQTEPELFQR